MCIIDNIQAILLKKKKKNREIWNSKDVACQNENMQVHSYMSIPLSSTQYFLLGVGHLQRKSRFKKVESIEMWIKERTLRLYAELVMESSWAVNMNEEVDVWRMNRIVFAST